MTKVEMISLVQGQLDAYNQRNLEKFCGFFHNNIIVRNLAAGTTVCEGMAAYQKIYGPLFANNPGLHCKLEHRTVLDSAVIDEEWVTGIEKFPEGLKAVAIYGFRDGLIDRVWFPG